MHRHNSFWLLLIAVGVVFLLNTFEVVPWEVWDHLWSWWPIIIIFAGLDLMAEHSAFMQRIIILIEVFLLLAILLSLTNGYNGYPTVPGLPREV